MRTMLRRLGAGEEGQDLAEYALLVAFVALAVLAAWLAIQSAVHDGYITMDTNEQDLSSSTPDPY